MRVVSTCVFLSFAVAGCGTSEPKFYTLERVVGPSEVADASTIEVRRPGLAGYLDRSEIVLNSDSYHVSTNDHDRWAEPLGDMIGRVLTQNLSQRLKNSSVYDQSGAITATPDARVEVNIVSLNRDDSGSVALNADIAIEQGATHRAIAARHITLQATTPDSEPETLVATMSSLLGTLSDRIATDVHSSTALAAASAPVAMAGPSAPPREIAVANNDMPNTLAPVAVLPAPVTGVAEHPLPPAACASGGRAVPCLKAP
jgi:uncharacterized lipoprotein YmbA